MISFLTTAQARHLFGIMSRRARKGARARASCARRLQRRFRARRGAGGDRVDAPTPPLPPKVPSPADELDHLLLNLLSKRAANGDLDKRIDLFNMRDEDTRRELLLLAKEPTSEVPIFGEARMPRLFAKFRDRLFVGFCPQPPP
eukprot:5406080-Pleurochrysis_carterae.AAC.2